MRVSRTKLALWVDVFKILGPGLAFKILESSEKRAIELYYELLEGNYLTAEEREKLREILEDELVHEDEIAEEGSKFKEFIGHVRDAVLGMNDGLVEVLSVSAGLAGAYGDPMYVAIGGLIVGVGGALSMGIGAFMSVRAHKQVRLGLMVRLSAAARYAAELLIKKVVESLKKRGISEETALKVAKEMLQKGSLSSVDAIEGFGASEEVIGNPAKAGLYTGLSYAVGAFVPLLPYFIMMPVRLALPASFLVASVMLSVMGFLIAITADLSIKAKIAEIVAAGIGSALLTFGIGKLASVLLGIEVT